MARKRHSDEDGLRLLREIEVYLASGSGVGTVCCTWVSGCDLLWVAQEARRYGPVPACGAEGASAGEPAAEEDRGRPELDKLILKGSLDFFET